MAVPLRMKRIARERPNLEKPNDDYFVQFKDDNLFSFHAYVIGPSDSLYAHKFVKLRFDIPLDYPLEPPTCTFIQHSGGRLHPNLYVGGKVCLSILGTWPGEKWATAMTIETVLITIRSLLDNSPYKHEPHQADNTDFNQYVQYTSWKSLLLDYVNNESDAVAKAFLEKHISQNGPDIIHELKRQTIENTELKHLISPYNQYGESRSKAPQVNYKGLLTEIVDLVEQCTTAEADRQALLLIDPSLEQIDTSNPSMTINEIETKPRKDSEISPAEPLSSNFSPVQSAMSQQKTGPIPNLPLPSSITAGSSSLKRKYGVIDATWFANGKP
ncbi:hypothetical protein MMC13_008099 [Lambiella insularis]|nr:hypothetical protein [Lambiella insularis]